MNRTRSSNNSITRERKERSHFKYGNRASVANDGYDEITDTTTLSMEEIDNMTAPKKEKMLLTHALLYYDFHVKHCASGHFTCSDGASLTPEDFAVFCYWS